MLYCMHSHGRAGFNVAEKEIQRADGDLRILLEAVQNDRIDQRVPDIPAAPSHAGSKLNVVAKEWNLKSARNRPGASFLSWTNTANS